jgi:hypothetical protein
MHVELRRHAGNERLPLSLRGSLRRLAQRAHARGARRAAAALRPYPRRLLLEAPGRPLPGELLARARRDAVAAGIDPDASIAVVEVCNRPDVLADACELLVSRGLTVAAIGHTLTPALRRPSIVELGSSPVGPALELLLVSRARLVICGGWDLQFVCSLLDRPSVTLNATEPFRPYPVRANGVYLLRTAIDLATGSELPLEHRLRDAYFRNLRHHGNREHTAADVAAAVSEVLEGGDAGPGHGTDAQARYRSLLTAAGERLAATVRHVAMWGPDRGFLGEGRLARVQAERLS